VGRCASSPATDFWPELGREQLWRAGRQVQGGDRRRNGIPSEEAGPAGQLAALEAVVEGHCGEYVHKQPSCGVEGEARCGGHGGAVAARGDDRRGCTREAAWLP
jgi:hypothetical protein